MSIQEMPFRPSSSSFPELNQRTEGRFRPLNPPVIAPVQAELVIQGIPSIMLFKIPTMSLPTGAIKLTGKAEKNARVFCSNKENLTQKYKKECPKKITEISLTIKAQNVYRRCLIHGEEQVAIHGFEAVVKNTHDLMESIRRQIVVELFHEYDPLVIAGKMTLQEREDIIRDSTRQWDFR